MISKTIKITRFLVIALMMVLIIFIYSIQRIVKDTLIISHLGEPELIPSLKLGAVLPSAIFVMLLYTRLCDFMKKTSLFHFFNIIFVSYFGIFTFIINPRKKKYHISLIKKDKEYLDFIRRTMIIIENWSYSIYYIYSELWGSVMLSLMFWQTSNQVFKMDEAKRLYPLFGFFGQLGMLLSDYIITKCNSKELAQNWQHSLNLTNSCVITASIILSVLYFVLSNYIIDERVINSIKMKKKMTFLQSLKYISNKYIALISIVVICYGISINLVEGVWKAQVKLLYNNEQSYASFMAKLQGYTGKASMISMAVGSYLLRLISWRIASLLTPLVILISGSTFFLFSVYQNFIGELIIISPMMIAVMAGFVQNVMSKATKYAFFDSTKEMAYIPLNEELKSKGKAAADIIGGRLGKSGGAAIQWLLLLIPGSNLISISPMISAIFITIIFIWIIVVNILANELLKITQR